MAPPASEPARCAYLGPDDTEAVDTDELLRRLDAGDVFVLDVRPEAEYVAGHLPGAAEVAIRLLRLVRPRIRVSPGASVSAVRTQFEVAATTGG